MASALAAGALLLLKPGWPAAVQMAFDAESVHEVAGYLRGFGLWTPAVSLLLMIAQAVIAPLPSSLIAGANGVLYGVWWGSLLSWAGGLAGAMASFWLARLLGEGVVGRWIEPRYIERIDRLGEVHGFWIVLAARLTPVISLDFIGYLAGLSRMRFGRYMLANLIGIAPGMLAYTLLGHDLALAQISGWRVSLILLAGLVLYLVGRRWLAAEYEEEDMSPIRARESFSPPEARIKRPKR